MLKAFCNALLVTLAGSITPASMRFPYSSFSASYPNALSFDFKIFLKTTAPSSPAFLDICFIGSVRAFFMMSTPKCSSPFNVRSSNVSDALKRATPPPGNTPSAIAARVACNASSTRAFFSFISVSVDAPTFICATPPANLANLSCNFSRS